MNEAQVQSRTNTRRAISWRSVLLGLIGVVLICGLSPYNDWAMSNTYLVGNFLPFGLLLYMLMMVLLLNAPLLKWAPRFALSTQELAVASAMMMISCTVPGSGLMRYLPGSLVAMHDQASQKPEYLSILKDANLPRWMLPSTSGSTWDERVNDDVIREFMQRSPDGTVPWAAWITPALTWGLFVGMMYGALMCLMIIVRKQWVENERLNFPLVTIYSSLIEPPENGRALNALFLSRGFWLTSIAVFIIHGFTALHLYVPRVPEFPLQYDLSGIMTDEPWKYVGGALSSSQIYFSIIGIAFFMQSKVSFSLWFFFIMYQVTLMITGTVNYPITSEMQQDQTFGAMTVFSLMLIWTGRQHWMLIIRHMFWRKRPGDPIGMYTPYWFAGWGLIACIAGMTIWLSIAGMGWMVAFATILIILMMMMTIGRAVAESGVIFCHYSWRLQRFWYYFYDFAPTSMSMNLSTTSIVGSSLLGVQWSLDLRECATPFMQNALRLNDDPQKAAHKSQWHAFGLIICLMLSLLVGYVVSGASMLQVEYNYAASMSNPPVVPLNQHGTEGFPRDNILEPARILTTSGPQNVHDPLNHIGIGAIIVGVTSILRLSFEWWPLHPLGFLLMHTWAMGEIWFSVFLGWLVKIILVRLGGATLWRNAKPIFIGLVIGEASAGAFWVIISFIVHWMGYQHYRVSLLPA